jgi:DNA-binding LacI/PurR family transcriptional regulator
VCRMHAARFMHEKPTSFDIAYLAGVSQPTVSRALRGSPSVSAETRKRIEDIARQLNYRVDKNASNLRSQHSNTLALLLFEDPTPDDSQINPFFLSMLGSITRASARRGYDLLVSFQQQSADWQQDYEDSRRADGIILLGYGDYELYRPRLDRLVAQGTHFVRFGPVHDGQPGVSVGCDNLQGGFQAAQHLAALGRKRIAFLGTKTGQYPESQDRYRGYVRGLEAARLEVDPALQVDAITTEESGHRATSSLLASGVPFDAIVSVADLTAMGALRALEEHGRDVPRDVAVVGFDDIPAASLTNPPLTTVLQDTSRAGELLVETLLSQIKGDGAKNCVIPTRLVIRRSCGANGFGARPRTGNHGG